MLLLDAALRRGDAEDALSAYEMDVFRAGEEVPVRTFVTSRRRGSARS